MRIENLIRKKVKLIFLIQFCEFFLFRQTCLQSNEFEERELKAKRKE
jgi:hypothetical protein